MTELARVGMEDARLYDPRDSSVGGIHALFIVRGDPAAYNLPPRPEVPTIYLRPGWTSAVVTGGLMVAATLVAFLSGGRR
jgi:formate dehydrogenase iron-sulfur subunit